MPPVHRVTPGKSPPLPELQHPHLGPKTRQKVEREALGCQVRSRLTLGVYSRCSVKPSSPSLWPVVSDSEYEHE